MEPPSLTPMSISACPSIRPSRPRSACRRASSSIDGFRNRRSSTAISAIMIGPPTNSPGRVLFVAILLLVVGTLDIIYGIGAASNARFVNGTQYVFTNLHTWGWITIIVGAIEVTAGLLAHGRRSLRPGDRN